MKKLILTLAAAAALTACQRAPQPATFTELLNSQLEKATTFSDSIIALDGTFIGGVYASQVDMQGIENPDRSEMLRGLRTVLGVDSDNESYLAGISMGLQVVNVYRDLSADGPIDKEKFFQAIATAFRLDSVSDAEVREVQPRFQQSFTDVKQRAQARLDAEVYNSEPARQNRLIGDNIAEKIQSNPEFSAVGNDGLMVRVIEPGNGDVINPNDIVVVAIAECHADSKHLIRSLGETPMYAGRPNHPVLESVIPFMSVGEQAEFFVPYQLAYGIVGNEGLKVGPCESIFCTVTVKPFERKQAE